jgi:hypothetical protein
MTNPEFRASESPRPPVPESPSPASTATRIWLTFLLLFCLVMGLLLLARGPVRETFVIPLLYLYWLSSLIFGSLPQAVFWAVLLLVTVILLARVLSKRPAAEPAHDRGVRPQQANYRLAHWAALTRRTAGGQSRDFYALNEFRRLIYAAWAYRANLNPADIERDVASGVLQPPPEFEFYLQDSRWSEPLDTGLWRRALRRLRSLLGRDEAPSPAPDLDAMLQSLERMANSE